MNTHLMTLRFLDDPITIEDAMDILLTYEHRASVALLTGMVLEEFEVVRDQRTMSVDVRIYGQGPWVTNNPRAVQHQTLIYNYMMEKGLLP